MVRDGWGGFNGFTSADYDALSDREIVESYFAPRDDNHRLIPINVRRREAKEGTASEWTAFPSTEELQIPPEALAVTQPDGRQPPACYRHLFWWHWRRHGKPTDYIMRRWTAKVTGVPFEEAATSGVA